MASGSSDPGNEVQALRQSAAERVRPVPRDRRGRVGRARSRFYAAAPLSGAQSAAVESARQQLPPQAGVGNLRQRPRPSQDAGTQCSRADRATLVRSLNQVLATQIVGTLRCRRHYYMAVGPMAEAMRQRFMEHAQRQLAHADRIAARIVQLEGSPDFNPHGLTERSHAEYIAGDTPESMIREDLVAQRIAIDSCRHLLAYLRAGDPATRRLVQELLASEQQHAEALARLLQQVSGPARAART